jgi:hypothetical protein
VELASTHDRVIRLVQEIARIREDNRQFFARGRHHHSEEILLGDREGSPLRRLLTHLLKNHRAPVGENRDLSLTLWRGF